MNAEYWLKFNALAAAFIRTYHENPESILSTGNTTDSFVGNIMQGLNAAHVFEVSDTIKKLLLMTDPPNKNDDIPLPFKYFFLDVQFTREELANVGIHIRADEITGALVTKGELILHNHDEDLQKVIDENEPVVLGHALRTTIFSRMPDGEGWFDTFNTNINLDEAAKEMDAGVLTNPTSDEKAKKFIHKFVINFLNFIHNPEVELIEHKRSEKNRKRRIKEGKVPLPTTSTIRVNGSLKKYIDYIEGESHLTRFEYRFWVRGHYRRLMSDYYKEKRIIFVPPFIKGKGILVEKFYSVEKKNESEN
jgi:hypothetical protein